jgi:apolipoprotein D and lipocalin family protein
MRLGVAALLLAALACSEEPPLEVAKVELERFEGGWYEIAKLPRVTQAGCTGTVAVYRLSSKNELDVYSECHEGELDGPARRMSARAVVTDPDEPAKLALDFGGFFGDYWIVEVDPDYRFAAVGHPSRDYLWILARKPEIPESDFTALSERVRAKGFDVDRLERTLQAPEGDSELPAKASIPPPREYGCSLAPPPSTSGLVTLSALLVALGAVVFRRKAR